MSEIAELERRITAALERIGRGVDGLAQRAVPEAGPVEAPLADASAREAALQDTIAHLTRQLDARGLDMQRMRLTVIQLRETLRALREQHTAGLTDVTALNAAMTVEIEALRLEREAELLEMDAILAELKPLVTEVQDA